MVVKEFLDLIKIKGKSLQEGLVCEYIKNRLTEIQVNFYEDNVGEKLKGQCGNIIATIEGEVEGRILFSAHMDTVEPLLDKEPIIENGIIKSDGTTILGGDDRAGIAVILQMLERIKRLNGKHKSVVCVFSVAEEIGIYGAKNLDVKALGNIDYGYVLDGEGSPGIVYNRAPYSAKGEIEVIGKEAHSGINPEDGINALVILSKAISRIKIGRVDKETTCNIGIVEGGVASNVVMPSVKIVFEARSLDEKKLDKLLEVVKEVFLEETKKMKGSLNFNIKKGTPGFFIDEEEKVIKSFKECCNKNDIEFSIKPCGGGSDTNIFNREGIKSVILGVGMQKVHSKEEYIKIDDLKKIEKILLSLI